MGGPQGLSSHRLYEFKLTEQLLFTRVKEARLEIRDQLVFLEVRVTGVNQDSKVHQVNKVNKDQLENLVKRVVTEEMVLREEVVVQERKEPWYDFKHELSFFIFIKSCYSAF